MPFRNVLHQDMGHISIPNLACFFSISVGKWWQVENLRLVFGKAGFYGAPGNIRSGLSNGVFFHYAGNYLSLSSQIKEILAYAGCWLKIYLRDGNFTEGRAKMLPVGDLGRRWCLGITWFKTTKSVEGLSWSRPRLRKFYPRYLILG